MYKEKLVVGQENDIHKYLASPQGSSKANYILRHPKKVTAVGCSSNYKESDDKKEGGTLKRRQKDSTLQISSFDLIMDETIRKNCTLYFMK